MKKIRQILAIIMIVLLVGMYVLTFILSIADRTETMWLFKASLACTFLFPITLYAFSLAYKVTHNDDTANNDSMNDDSEE